MKRCRRTAWPMMLFVCWGQTAEADEEVRLYQLSLGEEAGAVQTPGGSRARRLASGYAAFTSPFAPLSEGAKAIRLRVEAAGEEAKLGVRVLPHGAKRARLDSVGTGIWNRALTDKMQVFESSAIRLAEDVRSLRVLVYRSNQRGTLYLRSLEIVGLPLMPASELARQIEVELRQQGYAAERRGELLVGKKRDARCYYRAFSGQRMTREAFTAQAYIGTTWLRTDVEPSYFPAGPYIYGSASGQEARAEKLGMTLDGLFDHYARDVKAHGCNTIYYSNLTIEPEVFKRAVAVAQRHGIRVFAQLTRDLYLRVNRDETFYQEVTLPTARRIVPQYRGLEGVVAWMPKEEAAAPYMEHVARYRAEIKRLDPTHGIYTLHNSLGGFRAEREPLPEWFGFDRYRFRCLHGPYGILISTPKDAAIRLAADIRDFYEEAAKRGRPLIYVGQSYGHQDLLTAKEIRDTSQGNREDLDPWSGFKQVEPGKWLGWDRYPPPEHGMYLQSWIAIGEGAKGLLWFHYGPGTIKGCIQKRIDLVDEDGRETRLWRELGQFMREIRPFFPLIISWHKEAIPRAEADQEDIVVRSFIRRFDAERFLVVYNRRIATWDNGSPRLPRGKTELHFDDDGLAGLHPAEPITFLLTVEGEAPVWGLLTGHRLTATKSGACKLTLGPGRGTILMQGSPDVLQQVRKELGLGIQGSRWPQPNGRTPTDARVRPTDHRGIDPSPSVGLTLIPRLRDWQHGFSCSS